MHYIRLLGNVAVGMAPLSTTLDFHEIFLHFFLWWSSLYGTEKMFVKDFQLSSEISHNLADDMAYNFTNVFGNLWPHLWPQHSVHYSVFWSHIVLMQTLEGKSSFFFTCYLAASTQLASKAFFVISYMFTVCQERLHFFPHTVPLHSAVLHWNVRQVASQTVANIAMVHWFHRGNTCYLSRQINATGKKKGFDFSPKVCVGNSMWVMYRKLRSQISLVMPWLFIYCFIRGWDF